MLSVSTERLVLSSTLGALGALGALLPAFRVLSSRSVAFSKMLFRSILISRLLQFRATALSAVPEKTLVHSHFVTFGVTKGFIEMGTARKSFIIPDLTASLRAVWASRCLATMAAIPSPP